MTVDQDQSLDFSNAHQPRTTTFERALALLDEPARSHQPRRQRPRPGSDLDAHGYTTFSSTSMNVSLNSTPLTSPPRRRTRTSHPSLSLFGSPLKDYLKRHSTDSQGSEAERASTPRVASSSHSDRGHRAGDRSGSTSTSMSTSIPRTSTETPSRQTFTRDPFLDDQTIESTTSTTPTGTRTRTAEERPSATASLYVSPRRPLRSSIFESSPRIPLPSPSHSISTPAVASTSPGFTSREREKERKGDYSYERPRQTSATLRYALETSVRHRPLRHDQDHDGYSDGEEQGDGDEEDAVREQGRSQRDHPGHTSFLDTESDPPTELDERFPAIDPAPRSSPHRPQSTHPDTAIASQPEGHSHVQSTTSSSTSKSVDRGVPEQDIWRETESDYIRLPKTVTASTPPELGSVKGIDVEQIRSYVNGRARDTSTMEDHYADDEVGWAATHSAPVGWTSKPMVPDLPLSRRDLEETVQGLRDEMEVMRLQLETVVKAVGAGLKRNEGVTPVQPGLPQHILNALMTIDALVHYASPNERSPDQVLSVDNIEEMTRRIQDWEAIVRGRLSSSPSPIPVVPVDSGQQDQ